MNQGNTMNAKLDGANLRQLDAAHHLHPFTDNKSLGETGTRVIVRGEGIRIWDSEGNEIIDGMSGLWCVNLGYGRKDLVAAATHQMDDAALLQQLLQDHHGAGGAPKLAALIAEIAPPDMKHVFFSSSGSESNDTVVRMVRRYWDLLGASRSAR
jgi:putrescine---pyruvate transaminase